MTTVFNRQRFFGRSILTQASCGLILVSRLAWAQQGPPPMNPHAQVPMSQPVIREIGGGIFELGMVTLNKTTKTITFPGAINMTNGLLEYALVGQGGKLHESLLRTEVEPYHIHFAALFLMDKPPVVITNMNPTDLKLSGPPVSLWLTWNKGDREERARLEDLIRNDRTHSVMSQGTWIYNGSRLIEGRFTAHTDRSVVSIIEDFDALINNPREDRQNDEVWRVNEKAELPSVGTRVRITLQLESSGGMTQEGKQTSAKRPAKPSN